MCKPNNYYMISNRKESDTAPPPASSLTYYICSRKKSTWNLCDYDTWLSALKKDLATLDMPMSTVFFHGYGVNLSQAESKFPTYFENLYQNGEYPGVLIGFDWPSDGNKELLPKDFKNAKTNATETLTVSFPELNNTLNDVRSISDNHLSAICHSMGNYLMHQIAPAFSVNDETDANKLFDRILCVASMLERSSFNDAQSPTVSQNIIDASNYGVTIYWTTNDDVLPGAEIKGFDGYPELGIHGPGTINTKNSATYNNLFQKVISVDCSLAVNKANKGQADKVHTSYFYIQQVLLDIATTLVGNETTDRDLIDGTTGSYTMKAIES